MSSSSRYTSPGDNRAHKSAPLLPRLPYYNYLCINDLALSVTLLPLLPCPFPGFHVAHSDNANPSLREQMAHLLSGRASLDQKFKDDFVLPFSFGVDPDRAREDGDFSPLPPLLRFESLSACLFPYFSASAPHSPRACGDSPSLPFRLRVTISLASWSRPVPTRSQKPP